MDAKDHFITINGIRLHYRDWGGQGEVILFLAGLGCSAHIFDGLAPQFIDSHKVLGLTRRGHGKSDCPDSGYDVDTLAEDIIQFLSKLNIDKVIFVGHSMAHVELTHISIRRPDLVIKMVSLDPTLDTTKRTEIMEQYPLNLKERDDNLRKMRSIDEFIAKLLETSATYKKIWNDVLNKHLREILITNKDGFVVFPGSENSETEIMETINNFRTDYSKVKCPTLVFVAYPTIDHFLQVNADINLRKKMISFVEIFNSWKKENADTFIKLVENGNIFELENTSHYCFMDNEKIVVQKIKKFLY